MFHFNTLAPVVAYGLYQLRLVCYTADASDNLVNERIVNLCGSYAAATMEVFVDNRHSVHPPATPTHPYSSTPACPSPYASDHLCTLEPECYFRQICKNECQPDEQCFGACDIITLKSTDTPELCTLPLPVQQTRTTATFGGYTLQAIYAYSDVLTIGTAASGAPFPALVTTPRGTFEASPAGPRGADRAVLCAGAGAGRCPAVVVRRRLQGDAPGLRLPQVLRL